MPDPGAAAPQRRGRPRSAETDRSIRDAALQLLRLHGPGSVNVDAVAARSGVARTTIYRRYRSREELLAALLDELVETATPAPTLPVGEKLRWVLDRVEVLLEEGIGRGGTAAVLTDSDPVFAAALRERLAAQATTLTAAVADDVEAGVLSPDVDPETLVELLLGACLGEMLLHGSPRSGWTDRTVDLLTLAVGARPRRSGRSGRGRPE